MSSQKRSLEEQEWPVTAKKQCNDHGASRILKEIPINGLVSPPITPEKQRIIQLDNITSSKSGVRKLSLLSTPPTTPTRPRVTRSIYSQAKLLFHRASSVPVNGYLLPSRELESQKFESFIKSRILKLELASLYISGPPGTGKTAQTTSTMSGFISKYSKNKASKSSSTVHDLVIDGKDRRVAYIQLNCMIIDKPEQIYEEICSRLKVKRDLNRKFTSNDLKELLMDHEIADISVVVLDELDNLITKNQQILFELFSYAAAAASQQLGTKLVLIGIANALDLTDRFLPRLRANRINPSLLQFLPYSSDQIKNVIETKLGSNCLIHPLAIQLCSKKTASNTGDLRKLFDICLRSLEMVEQNVKSKMSLEEFENLTIEKLPKVSIANVAKVCSMVFNASNFTNDSGDKLKKLNLQQKTVLCSLVKFEESLVNNIKAKTINEFYDFYKTKIKLDNLIGFLKKGEFLDVITTLESFGIINSSMGMTKKNMELGSSRISSNVKRDDLLKAVEDVSLLKKLINTDL